MSLKELKQILVAGILGVSLVGCSSTPTQEAADAAQSQASVAEESAAQAEASAAESAAQAQAQALADAEKKMSDLVTMVVNFDFDRSDIKPEFYEVIKQHADYLSVKTDATVTIEGHCDERGSAEYNLALGERRAKAVKNALIAEGVSPSRIMTNSYGEEKPVDEGHTESAWSKNRRAEFKY